MKSGQSLLAAAGLAFALALATFVSLAAPTAMFGDSAELQTVGLVGGIPHTTGYPSFVLIGRLFAHLPFADPGFRITFMSACFGAATIGLFVLLLGELGVPAVPSLVGALLFGTSFTFWRVSLRAEVYSLSMFLALLALWRTLVALRGQRLADAVLAGFLIGLSLTGHLSFILPAALLGLTLAWHRFRLRPPAFGELVALLLAFVLGLTPYLYLMWADTRPVPVNYLKLVDLVQNPLGRPLPGFETPWQRMAWLVTGRNQWPAEPIAIAPLATIKNLIHSGGVIFLFELGPLALVLAVAGFLEQWKRDASRTLLLAGVGALSLGFTAVIARGPMTHIFLLPATAVCALFAAAGLERFYPGFAESARRAGFWLLAPAALALVVVALPPHLIRIAANTRPIGPWRLHVEEEDPTFKPPALPSLRGFREPRRYGEQVMAVAPRGALVLAFWPEFGNLVYFQVVEKKRPDLTLQPMSLGSLALRMRMWQEAHPGGQRPFVFTSRPPDFGPAGARLDSLVVSPGHTLWIRHTPIPGRSR